MARPENSFYKVSVTNTTSEVVSYEEIGYVENGSEEFIYPIYYNLAVTGNKIVKYDITSITKEHEIIPYRLGNSSGFYKEVGYINNNEENFNYPIYADNITEDDMVLGYDVSDEYGTVYLAEYPEIDTESIFNVDEGDVVPLNEEQNADKKLIIYNGKIDTPTSMLNLIPSSQENFSLIAKKKEIGNTTFVYFHFVIL